MSKAYLPPLRSPYHTPAVEREHAGEILRYVERRLAGQSTAVPIVRVRVDTHPDAYHAVVEVDATQDEIPFEFRGLVADIEEEFEEGGYPVLVSLRPTRRVP